MQATVKLRGGRQDDSTPHSVSDEILLFLGAHCIILGYGSHAACRRYLSGARSDERANNIGDLQCLRCCREESGRPSKRHAKQ
jgi:hypothetical protein